MPRAGHRWPGTSPGTGRSRAYRWSSPPRGRRGRHRRDARAGAGWAARGPACEPPPPPSRWPRGPLRIRWPPGARAPCPPRAPDPRARAAPRSRYRCRRDARSAAGSRPGRQPRPSAAGRPAGLSWDRSPAMLEHPRAAPPPARPAGRVPAQGPRRPDRRAAGQGRPRRGRGRPAGRRPQEPCCRGASAGARRCWRRRRGE